MKGRGGDPAYSNPACPRIVGRAANEFTESSLFVLIPFLEFLMAGTPMRYFPSGMFLFELTDDGMQPGMHSFRSSKIANRLRSWRVPDKVACHCRTFILAHQN